MRFYSPSKLSATAGYVYPSSAYYRLQDDLQLVEQHDIFVPLGKL